MSNKLAVMYKELRELPMTFRLLRRVMERNRELTSENEKLAMDNLDMLEEFSSAMDKYHELEMEVEYLRSSKLQLQEFTESLDLRYQQGINAGKDTIIAAVQKVLTMSPEELAESTSVEGKGRIHTEKIVSDNDATLDVHHGQWAVYDRICQHGGCDMPSYYPDEYRARIYAAILNVAKIPVIRDMCDVCRQEYIKEII